MNEEPEKANQAQGEPAARRSTVKFIFFNQRELRPGWRLLIYIVLAVVFVVALHMGAVWLHLPLPSLRHMDATNMLISEILSVIAAFGAAALMGKFEHRRFGVYGLPARQAFRGRFWQGVVWGLVMISVVMLLIALGGGFSFGRLALAPGAIVGYAALWGLVFLTVGFFEEFLFRGYTQFTLTTGIGFWPAAILLSAGFASAHLANKGEGPVGALSVFVIAMFFCLTLRRTGSLWFAVGLHAAWDWGETFLYSVPNSGLVAPGHLSYSALHGPVWLTGGTVGPEGSVMTFAIIGMAALVFAFWYRQPPVLPDDAAAPASPAA